MPGPIAGRFATREEELALIAAAKAGDRNARDLLVESNMPFICKSTLKIIRRFTRDPIDEWIGLAVEGWLHAIEKFDPSLGHRLSTYGFNWIYQKIAHFQVENRGVIRVPRTTKNAKNPEQYRAAAERAYNCTSIADDMPHPMVPEPPDDRPDPELVALAEAEAKKIEPRLYGILMSRMRGETLKQIGEQHGVSSEAIRQLETQALKEVRYRLGYLPQFRNTGIAQMGLGAR